MRLLVSGATKTVREFEKTELGQKYLGRLYTPRDRNSVKYSLPWACDNSAFSNFDETAYIKMLDKITNVPGCMWVSSPDTVGNAQETLEKFIKWQPILKIERNLPVALVGQDGLRLSDIPWDDFECLFIGGTTEWKQSNETSNMAKLAKTKGKIVHIGRVNSLKRLRSWFGIADSIDGSKFSMYANTYLQRYLEEIDELTKRQKC